MSIASIIEKASGIIADAQALPAPGAPAFPPAMDCLAGTISLLPAFTPDYWWQSMVGFHVRQQSQFKAGHIPVIGTSITQSWDVSQIHPACVNLGIAGDTITGALNRIGQYQSLHRAGAVILELGANDAGFVQIGDISALLDKLYGWLTGPLVILSLVPNGTPNTLSQATMTAVNGYFASKTAGRQKCVVVNITDPLRDADGWMKTSLSIGDRLHPNAAGYAVLNPLVSSALATVL